MAPGTMLKDEKVYEVPPYYAWRIAFYNTSRTWLVFGPKAKAKALAAKLQDQIIRDGGYVSNMSIKNVTKFLER